ncbi:MAG TPA: phosphoribosyltransferase [Candidatus Nitrosotalea sp.]|nr:phosphoribosyltransferase [Candidatus Nitrosotalea sp.]
MVKQNWEGKSNLTWKEIETCVSILSNKIKKSGFEFDVIATVSRGGLIPARLIADQFDIKKIRIDKNVIPKRTLFVDDIYDSGNTFRRILPLVKDPKNFVYTTLIARKGVRYPKNLIYAKKTRGKEYVIFPWDKLEFERIPSDTKD